MRYLYPYAIIVHGRSFRKESRPAVRDGSNKRQKSTAAMLQTSEMGAVPHPTSPSPSTQLHLLYRPGLERERNESLNELLLLLQAVFQFRFSSGTHRFRVRCSTPLGRRSTLLYPICARNETVYVCVAARVTEQYTHGRTVQSLASPLLNGARFLHDGQHVSRLM